MSGRWTRSCASTSWISTAKTGCHSTRGLATAIRSVPTSYRRSTRRTSNTRYASGGRTGTSFSWTTSELRTPGRRTRGRAKSLSLWPMAALSPFRALRPAPESAAAVASVPYDVVSTEEARALVADNPLSFLRVTRAEIDLPSSTDPYGAVVYEQAVHNLEELKRAAPLVLDDRPSLYVYRLA